MAAIALKSAGCIMSKRLWLWTLVLISSVIMVSSSFAKIYWLPEYLGSNMDKNRVSDGGLSEVTTTCEEAGLISSCPEHKKPTTSVPVGNKTCYKSCSCDRSYYQYSSSNCESPKVLGGESCDALASNGVFSDSSTLDSVATTNGLKPATSKINTGTKTAAAQRNTGTKAAATQSSSRLSDTIYAPGFGDKVTATTIKGYFTTCTCPSDYSLSSCPANSTCEKCDNKYKVTGCNANYELVDGKCQATSCPSGYVNPEDISERTALGQTCNSVTVNGMSCYLCSCDINKYCNAACPTGASSCSTCRMSSTGTPNYKIDGCKTGYTKTTDSAGNITSCKAAACPAGYTAGVTECADDYSYLESGYSGEQKCGRCVCSPQSCTGYTLTKKPMNATYETCVKGCGDNTTYYKIKSCYPNTTLVNDTCIYCRPGTTLVNGKCVYPSCQAFLEAKYPAAVYVSDGQEMRDAIDEGRTMIIMATDNISKSIDLTYPIEIYTEDKFVEESNGVCKASGVNTLNWSQLFIDGSSARITTNIRGFSIDELSINATHTGDFLGVTSVDIKNLRVTTTQTKVVIPNEEVAFDAANIYLSKNSNLVINNPSGHIDNIETEEGSFLELGDHNYYGTVPLRAIDTMNIKGSVKLKHSASTMTDVNNDVVEIGSVNAIISPKTGNTYTNNNLIIAGNVYIGNRYVSLDIQKNVNVLINSDFSVSYCEEAGTCNEGMDDCDKQAYENDFYEPVPYINGEITKFILNVGGSLQGVDLTNNRVASCVFGAQNITDYDDSYGAIDEGAGYCEISTGSPRYRTLPHHVYNMPIEYLGRKLDNN